MQTSSSIRFKYGPTSVPPKSDIFRPEAQAWLGRKLARGLGPHKLQRFPIIAMGSEFWDQMRTFVRGALVTEKTISPEDRELLQATDSPEEAVRLIHEGVTRMTSSPAVSVD
jgi:hypothetical protein